jgi:NAD(P)-dependent dehydrogenase (short-subunit alcohol dehydrogenase family)
MAFAADVQTRFRAESTAEEVIAGHDLTGKLAVVTGAGGGIGKETARVLAQAGADVVVGGRDRAGLDAVCAELQPAVRGKLIPIHVDLASLKSVDAFADAILSLGRPIDLQINNAGVMASPFARSAEGIETQLAINFVGHAWLTSRLMPALLRAPEPRVIAVGSSAHQYKPLDLYDINYANRPYDAWDGYGEAKTAVSLFAFKLWQEAGAKGITAHTLHPGGAITGLMRNAPPNIAEFLMERYPADFSGVLLKTIEQGASTQIWAATEPTLAHRPALYLEDCGVAKLIAEPCYHRGVMAYAIDPEDASRLWAETEKLLGRRMPLDGS